MRAVRALASMCAAVAAWGAGGMASAAGGAMDATGTPGQGYEVPERWQPLSICGRGFWLEAPFYQTYQDLFARARIADEPFLRHGAFRVHWDVILDPDSPLYRTLLGLPNPVILRSGYHHFEEGMRELPEGIYRRFERDFGERFLGIHGIHERMGALEWGGPLDDVLAEIQRKTGTPVERPTTREEAYDVMRAQYRSLTQESYYRVYATTAAPQDHFLMELGVALSSCEVGPWIPCAPMQFAASRGASRRYSRPWGAMIAGWGKGLVGDSHCAFNFLWPEARRTEGSLGYMDEGPYSGTSYSLQKRLLYTAYMAGANLITHESDCNYRSETPQNPATELQSAFVANYDYRTIDGVDTLVRVLRDRPYHLSPIGEVFRTFYDRIVSVRDRGVPYTPVALVLPRHHGIASAYSSDSIYNARVPYQEGDYMARAVVNTLWPWEHQPVTEWGNTEARVLMAGPCGDVFDIQVDSTPPDALRAYRALVLAGPVTVDEAFGAALRGYVEQGGVLLANIRQAGDLLPPAYFGCEPAGGWAEVKQTRHVPTGAVCQEGAPFSYQRVRLTDGTALVVPEHGKDADPVAVVARRGAGTGILFLAPWSLPPGLRNTTLACFQQVLKEAVASLSPVRIEGDVEVLLNRSSTSWIVTLVNSHGVVKPAGQPERINSAQNRDVIVRLRRAALPPATVQALEWLTEQPLPVKTDAGAHTVRVRVPAGDLRIVEIRGLTPRSHPDFPKRSLHRRRFRRTGRSGRPGNSYGPEY